MLQKCNINIKKGIVNFRKDNWIDKKIGIEKKKKTIYYIRVKKEV